MSPLQIGPLGASLAEYVTDSPNEFHDFKEHCEAHGLEFYTLTPEHFGSTTKHIYAEALLLSHLLGTDIAPWTLDSRLLVMLGLTNAPALVERA